MSKQSKAKEEQGYEAKPIFNMCSNCKHFKSEMITEQTSFGDYTKETNIHCSLGGFAVKKQGTCNKHEQ